MHMLSKIVISGCLAFLSLAWQRPQLPPKARLPQSAPALRLDHLLIEVNGVMRRIPDQGELSIVAGDKLKVKDAILMDRSAAASEVNVVGFQRPDLQSADDRGFFFDSAEHLLPSWSERGKGEVYAVTAVSAAYFHGVVFLRIIPPALQYAVLEVNGEAQTLRDGEQLTVKRTDTIKVNRVISNISDLSDIAVRIFQVDPNGPEAERHEIRFSRGRQVFARISLIMAAS